MKVITKEQEDVFMRSLEDDYWGKEKSLLFPTNNREYWLFTEVWQRCRSFFDSLGSTGDEETLV